MTDLRTQIREYAARVTEEQSPVDATEAMTRRGAVRELPRQRRMQDVARGGAPRWVYAVASIVVAGAIGVGIIWLATPTGDGPAEPGTTIPTPTTTVPTTTTAPPATTTTVATTTTIPATTTTAAPTTTVAAAPAGPVPSVLDVVTYGGRGFDYATAVAPLADGGAVVAIDYRSDGDGDLTVARYSATNEVTWATTWSTEVEDAPMRGAIDVDADGNALVGVSLFDSSSGDRDAAIVKFGPDGDLVWARAALGADGGQRPHVVAAAEDGSAFVAGHHGLPDTAEAALVMRVAADGTLLWQRALVGNGDVGASIFSGMADPSGGVVLAGTVGDYQDEVDAFIVKVDASGEVVWQRSWGVPGSPDRAWNLVVDPDGNVYVSGPVAGVGNGGDSTFVVKVDPDGELVWSRIWQIPGNEIWSSGTAFGDGLLVVSGFIGRVDAEGLRMDKSSYLLGIDPDGDLRWQAAIGARPLESIESMAFAPDGTLIAVGQGEGAEQNVVALDGEWLDPGIAVTVTDLAATDLGLSWVEAVGTVGAAEGVPGGGTGADAFVMRLDLP